MNLDAYRVLDLPAQVGVSGGRTSGYMTYHILEAFNGAPPADMIFTFQNTGEECEETLDFLHEMETRWPLPLVWLEWDDIFRIQDYAKPDGTVSRNRQRGQASAFRVVSYETAARKGEPFERMLAYYADYRREVKGLGPILPTLLTRMCTSNLKIKTAARYMASLGYLDPFSVVGIRYDEPRRWTKMFGDNARANFVLPLYEDKVTKPQVNTWWSQQSFDLRLDKESIEGNCRHCFLKHPDKAIAIMKKVMAANDGEPDAELQRWLIREASTDMYFRRDRPPYAELVQIAKNELATGKKTDMDFSLVPEFSCQCAGVAEEGED